jgi:hypothetical protein
MAVDIDQRILGTERQGDSLCKIVAGGEDCSLHAHRIIDCLDGRHTHLRTERLYS